MYCSVSGMVHVNDPLLLNGLYSDGSVFPLFHYLNGPLLYV